MTDHYTTLGVNSTATQDEIKKAYRKLASLHHPDKGGNTAKFQDLQTAYNTLSDPAQRQQYDNPKPSFGNFGQRPQQGGPQFDFDTIFDVFGARFTQPNRQRQQQVISRAGLTISLTDVAVGGKRTIGIGQNSTIEIEIPKGINDNDNVQYKGLAPGGGDLVITFRVREDAKWQRNGANLLTEHHVDIWDLILGCESIVKDLLDQQITILIPKGTQPGARLRLRGKGLPSKTGPGDIIVQIQAIIPTEIPEDLLHMIALKRTTNS
jgi:DnaJ-class molecular chaperone